MSTQSANGNRISISDIAIVGVMVATLEAAKIAMSFLPNIEIVTLLIMLYTICLSKKTIYAIFVFVLIEGCLYGFGVWWIMYLYIWPLLSLITYVLRKQNSTIVFACISGFFGLFFGALCSIPYFFIGGVSMGFSYFVAGISFDIIHCVSNVVLCLILWHPLYTVLRRLTNNSTTRE